MPGAEQKGATARPRRPRGTKAAPSGYLGLGEIFDDRILGTDSAHVFFVSAQALAAHAMLVVEVGCGRGAAVELDQPGGPWQDLRGEGRTVIGIDIEDAGTANPVIDEFRLIDADGHWPLDDASVDLAVSDYVLEHVTDPEAFVKELARVLRPGGTFIGRTVSRRSLLSIVARVVPNERHAGAVAHLQPGREAQDVFHTAYKMNTRADLARVFDADFDWALAHRTGLEQYFKPWPRLRKVVGATERYLPTSTWMGLVVFARRRPSGGTA
ncbi:MAG TPA: class I SAM-dependent methyltransferase [Acidimicrobiales bacterium]|jgi:SAM-dependent methyltransferase|nr:class I SAM-dependent methyltransferase [Acidimicrobiales bacterium]